MTLSKENKKWLNTILIILLTLGALYFNLKDVYQQVFISLSQVNLLFLACAILLILIYYAFDGVIITMISKLYNKSYTFLNGFRSVFIGVFFSSVTPFATGGEVARIYVLSKQGLKPSQATSVLLMNFIVYQTVLVLYGLFAVVIRFNYFFANYRNLFYLVLLGFFVNGLVISMLILASLSKRLHNFIKDHFLKFLKKIKVIKNYEGSREKFEHQVGQFQKEITNLYKNKKLLFKALIIQIIRLTIFHSIPFFALKALDPSIEFQTIGETIILSIFVSNVLAAVPIPGDNGISETIFILMFKTLFGVVLVSTGMIIWRFITYFLAMIVGGILFIFNPKLKQYVPMDIKSMEVIKNFPDEEQDIVNEVDSDQQ